MLRSSTDDTRQLTQPLLPEPVVPAMSRCGSSREVGVHRLARYVLAQPDHEWSGGLRELVVDVAQGDQVGSLVGDLHPHRRLARDGSQDADLGAGQRVGQIVSQRRHLGHLGAWGQLQLVPGHARTYDHPDDPGLHAELRQRLEQHRAYITLVGATPGGWSALVQHVGLGQQVAGLAHRQLYLPGRPRKTRECRLTRVAIVIIILHVLPVQTRAVHARGDDAPRGHRQGVRGAVRSEPGF